jgi:hypothetical protein
VPLERYKSLTKLFYDSEKTAEDAYAKLSAKFVELKAYERLAGSAALHLSSYETERRKSERKFYDPVNIKVRLTRGEGRIMSHIVAQEVAQGTDGASLQNAPPSLSFEGGKVQPDWLYQFLHNVKPLRVGLHVRMPSFWTGGPYTSYKTIYPAGHLSAVNPEKREKGVSGEPLAGPDAIKLEDVPDDAQQIVDFFINDANERSYGHQPVLLDAEEKQLYDLGKKLVMVPTDAKNPAAGGMGCVECHSIGNKVQPMPKYAPNLANVKRRLKDDWMRRFITMPQAIYPWTNMTPFFINWNNYTPDFKLPTRGVLDDESVMKEQAQKLNAVRFFLMHSGDGELGSDAPAAPAPPAPAPPAPATGGAPPPK